MALALLNGRVYTQDPRLPTVHAVAVVGNRIAAVGSDEEALAAAGPLLAEAFLAGGPWQVATAAACPA